MALQARENDAVGGDADEEGRSGRGDVDDGAVVVLQEAELDGGQLCALDGVGGSVRREGKQAKSSAQQSSSSTLLREQASKLGGFVLGAAKQEPAAESKQQATWPQGQATSR